ncbi:MAG: O-antigen ligase family protein [Hypericibacter sp.]
MAIALEAGTERLATPSWRSAEIVPPPQTGWLNLAVGHTLLFLLLAFGMIGARPFSGADIDSASTASDGFLNQAIWLGGVALALPLIFSRFRLAVALVKQAWPLLLVIAWDMATAIWSPLPDVTLRRVAVLWLMYAAALGVAVSGVSLRDFHRMAFLITGVVMALDIMAAVGMPGRGLDNEGRLIGMHGHKNSAGQVAVMASLCWYFYAARFPWRSTRFLVLGAAGIFYLVIFATGSKTGSALAMLVVIWTAIAVTLCRRGPSAAALFGSAFSFLALAVLALLMLTGVSATEVGTAVFGDITFTGRLPLWEVIWDQIMKHFWTGYGFGAFWDVAGSDNSFGFSKAVGWLGVVGQAHNGYLDLFLQTGLVGLGLALFSLGWMFRVGARLLGQPPRRPFDLPARAFAYAMILSIALYNLLESSYLRPHHMQAVWLFMLVALMQRELLEGRVIRQRILLHRQKAALAHRASLVGTSREPFLTA